MFDYISGRIAELTPTAAIIDCSGIGYEINISLMDFTILQQQQSTKLYIHESIREDAHVLFGFTTQKGRELFRLLIGVSGVGPNTARLIMSATGVDELGNAIASGNHSMLKAVKGIGAKTAQRIIVDLRDKIKPDEAPLVNQSMVSSESYEESLAALLMLGFNRPQSEKALKKIFTDNPSTNVESAIKQALKIL